MAVFNRTVLLVTVVSVSFLYFGVSRNHDLGVKDLVLLAGRFFLGLALLSFIISLVTPWIQKKSSFRSPPSTVSEDEKEQRRVLARKEQQEKLREKGSVYTDSVLIPRQEVKLRQQEERFYRATGQTWKLTEGHQLGVFEEASNEDFVPDETPNKEALKKRKLPEHVTKPLPPAEAPIAKKVLVLPEEPEETAEGAVTIALRCPSGRVFKRRFLKTYDSCVLLDWMMKLGYHSALYSWEQTASPLKFNEKPLPASCPSPGRRSVQAFYCLCLGQRRMFNEVLCWEYAKPPSSK
ncbi:UBX domain-containing protein 8 isoform X2 [Ambystoma mexicanum]|uniref:UBX domain-containing protein 8 isoform X2 n=1 Tax=Ambystoma mexicanum TaxID=8296 RepID=UPI0037E9776F